MDPARIKELVDPEFLPDSDLFVVRGPGGEIGGRYDTLPAAVAGDPTAIGVFFGKGEFSATALVAILWDGRNTNVHRLNPPVVGRTNTVADAAGESIPGGEGACSCDTCTLEAAAA